MYFGIFMNFMKGTSGQHKAVFSYLAAGSKMISSASAWTLLNNSGPQKSKQAIQHSMA